MAIIDLSGTSAVRFPDPPVPRVSPNGVQPYSAYNAVYLYYDPTLGAWSTTITPATVGSDLRAIETLLFGTDYPALVTATSYYGENLGTLGNYFPTFNK